MDPEGLAGWLEGLGGVEVALGPGCWLEGLEVTLGAGCWLEGLGGVEGWSVWNSTYLSLHGEKRYSGCL